MENNKKDKTGFLSAMSLGAALGFLIALPLVAFLLLGLFLDNKLNASPVFLLVSVLLSLFFAVFEIRYFILPFMEKRSKSKNNSA